MSLLRKIKKTLGYHPPEKFVIICHQRSGSNMLASMLDKHSEIQFLGQLFKSDNSWQKFLKQKNVIPFKGQLFDDQPETRDRFDYLQSKPQEREHRNTGEFITEYFAKREKEEKGKLVGIKFHGGTLYNDEIKDLILEKDYKVILLYRENLLASAISWYRARALDQWTSKSSSDIKKTSLIMDIDQLEWFIEKTREDIILWKKLLQNKYHLELTYEEITNIEFRFSRLWEFFEIKDIGRPIPKTKKLIKSYEDIQNIEEIRSHFKDKNVGIV